MQKARALYDFLWLSRPLMQQIETAVEARLRGTGLTVRMRAVLEILDRDGALSVPELARRLEIQRQYVQVMVNETHAAGYTEKQDNPRHKSSPLIGITAAGNTLMSQVQSRETALVDALASRFSDADIAASLALARECHAMLRAENRKEAH